MQDEFKLKKVWILVYLPNGKRAMSTKWVYRNKKDERGIVIKNKARLIAQGYTKEEGIDYDEVFAPVARIEAIKLFLAYASFKDFVVYQMDVNSTFLYGRIEEEVYVYQPIGFEDPDFPDRVYKVENELYGLHQPPRAWYETLSTYLLENRFQREQIDKTLFIKRGQSDILIVHIYVDDIIFGFTKKKLRTKFEKMMHKKFQMSSMGKLTFFLGLEVKQKEDGIFISQDKYVTEILKKFSFSDVKIANTPMETHSLYSKKFQVNPKVSHLRVVKRIFRYLKGQPKLGLWYPKDLPFDLVAYTDSDYAGASLDRKSTTGGIGVNTGNSKLMLLGINLLLLEKVNAARHNLLLLVVKTVNGEVQLQALVDGNKVIITETSVRRDLQLEDAEGIACLPNADIFEQLALMEYEKPSQKLTFYKAFFSPQWKFLIHTILQCLSAKSTAWNENVHSSVKFLMYLRFVQVFLNQQAGDMSNHKRIYVTPSHTKKVFGNMKREGKGFSGRVTPLFPTMMVHAQEEMGEEPIADEAANAENVPTHSNDPLLSGDFKFEVKSQEEDASKLGRKIDNIDKDTEVTLVDETQGRYGDDLVFDTSVLDGEEGFAGQDVVEKEVSTTDPVTTASAEVSDATTTTTTTITEVDLTFAQALAELRSAKSKVVVQEPVQSTTTTTPSIIPKTKSITFKDPGESKTRTTLTPIPLNIKDKGKAKMIEPEKPLKKTKQIRLDKELAFKLQDEEEEQARLIREKAEEVKEATFHEIMYKQ
ncbi:putative ribonuclease H-like domain-containing protein [Tanacetum coccineum]